MVALRIWIAGETIYFLDSLDYYTLFPSEYELDEYLIKQYLLITNSELIVNRGMWMLCEYALIVTHATYTTIL
jgi:hypothetical protein